MSELHFANLDLNLLRVFDALIEERSVTRAGARLGLTQSAVSHALSRLRLVLGDALFVRKAGGIEPTPRALEIGPALHSALRQLQEALSPPQFTPHIAERRFTLAAGPYACTILAPSLVERLHQTAPGVRLQIQAYGSDVHESLEVGRLDAAIVGQHSQRAGFTFLPLFTEDMVWVARRDHPLTGGKITEARLAASRRIVISAYREAVEGVAGVGAAISRRSAQPEGEDVSVTVPDAFSAVVIATRTDMITLAPRRLAEISSSSGRATVIEPLRPIEPLEVGALFRTDRLSQPALSWFAKTLRTAAQGL
ncbi:MAG TPA: LysR substrate-binding domain-containing protein [Caulobacteraceae bacterium]|nr:LysR substrate-binding domain-containing protein [Caulobacteraceae bacterium]